MSKRVLNAFLGAHVISGDGLDAWIDNHGELSIRAEGQHRLDCLLPWEYGGSVYVLFEDGESIWWPRADLASLACDRVDARATFVRKADLPPERLSSV